MKGIAYGALAGIAAGVACFGTGFLIVSTIGVPDGSHFGVGVEPWNLPGTLLGLAVWFHLLTLTWKRGIPTAIVSVLAYNGVRLVGWGFGLKTLWAIVHGRWGVAMGSFVAYWAFGLIREHGFEHHRRVPGLDTTQGELGERLTVSQAPVAVEMRKWQRWEQVALLGFGVVLAVLAYLEK